MDQKIICSKNGLGGTPRVEPEFGSSEMGVGMGMYDSKAQDWEGDEINPFPQLGNEKGMKRMILAQFLTIFQFLCDARSWIGKFDYRKGIKWIHSNNSKWEGEKRQLPKFGNGKGMKISGTGIRGFRSWEWMGIGIPAHPLKCYGYYETQCRMAKVWQALQPKSCKLW